jgi:hypothetical protein
MTRSKKHTQLIQDLVCKYPQFTFDEMVKIWRQWKQRKNNLANGKTLDVIGNPYFMLLTFIEWLDIWLKSGHFHERGTGKDGYCMMRNNDIGNYEIGNVTIGTIQKNSSDANTGRTPPNKGKPSPLKGKPSGRKGTGVKKPTGTCIHCGIVCANNNLSRYHNDNCKKKPQN